MAFLIWIYIPFAKKRSDRKPNYFVDLDIGFNDKILLPFLRVKQTYNILNNFAMQPENLWRSYGAAFRWQTLNQNNWKLAINGSLEAWEVGSGRDESSVTTGTSRSNNIFNDSSERVFTSNIVGSLGIPLSWQASKYWQFSFIPAVSFLPTMQGIGQGGAGKFYGTNFYVSGGVLFQALPELGLSASITQPIGSGTNSFNSDLIFSRVPIYSAGINWNLNPRIGFKGLITNGYGTTPATALLALPSENRMGYSASFIYTPNTADSPQVPLTARQKSLAKGGLTVNTALVPVDTTSETWFSTDGNGNLNGSVNYSLSNVFQLNILSGRGHSNSQKPTSQESLFTSNGRRRWGIGGKVTAFSPLRGAPFWGGGKVTFGENLGIVNKNPSGYLLVESMATFEIAENLAININPKVAWSQSDSLWALGIGANLQLLPDWELITESNIVINKISQGNATLGLRWHATNDLTVEIYGSTADSLIDIGQVMNTQNVSFGSRLILTL